MISRKTLFLASALAILGSFWWWGIRDSAGSELEKEFSALAKLVQWEGHGGDQAAWFSNLDRLMEQAPRHDLSSGLKRFLDSDENAYLGGEFGFSDDGHWSRVPDLRAYLLVSWYSLYPEDALEWIRQRDPQFVRSPGEMGIMASLIGPEDGVVLMALWEESLKRDSWWTMEEPAVLELVDMAVALKASEDIIRLWEKHRDDVGRGFRFAMYLSLDRLMMTDPLDTWFSITKENWLQSEWPMSVASLATRLDPGDPLQELALEEFLLSPDTTSEQVLHFAGLMPNFNAALSRNLVTPSPIPSADEVESRIRSSWEWAGELSERRDEPHLATVGQIIRGKVEPWLEPKL